MIEANSPFYLKPTVQNYHWGKIGVTSIISKLIKEDQNIPYAELWYGAHPSSSSRVEFIDQDNRQSSSIGFDQLISLFPEKILGAKSITNFGATLPFLFKVLSIQKPLSIQAHPDLILAKKLHAKDPKHYPDSSHKPEVAVALTEVELLYGFKDRDLLDQTFVRYPEIATLIESELLEIVKSSTEPTIPSDVLKAIFTSLLTCQLANYQQSTKALISRLKNEQKLDKHETLALSVFEDYGEADRGILSLFLLNFVNLKPFEAVYVEPNTLHAYLSGELVECMANSDNVVRAGLTPKFVDIDVLLSMLNYEKQGIPELLLTREMDLNGNHLRYQAPVREFAVEKLSGKKVLISKTANKIPMLIVLVEGTAEVRWQSKKFPLFSGDSIFVPSACESFQLELDSGLVFCLGTAI